MGLIAIRGFREADWPRLQAIHDAARMDELRLAGLGREEILKLCQNLLDREGEA